MALQNQQNFLVRLFTDESLRQNFLDAPEKVGDENDLSREDIESFRTLVSEQFNFFADSLFHKRLHEVEKFLPQTKNKLGKDFQKIFREFSATFQPQTVKKHLEDSVKFADFLEKKENVADWIKDIASFERARLLFNGYGKPVVYRLFNYDIRQLNLDILPKRKTFAIWIKIGKASKHIIL